MSSTRRMAYVLIGAGGVWLGVLIFVLTGNVILRETPLGVIARVFDRLPSPLQGIVFLACWGIFILGWIVPVIYSLRLLARCNK